MLATEYAEYYEIELQGDGESDFAFRSTLVQNPKPEVDSMMALMAVMLFG